MVSFNGNLCLFIHPILMSDILRNKRRVLGHWLKGGLGAGGDGDQLGCLPAPLLF